MFKFIKQLVNPKQKDIESDVYRIISVQDEYLAQYYCKEYRCWASLHYCFNKIDSTVSPELVEGSREEYYVTKDEATRRISDHIKELARVEAAEKIHSIDYSDVAVAEVIEVKIYKRK
jgi:hypothetical protein